MVKNKGFLAIGNFDSNVGYAWKLMESFWVHIHQQLKPSGYNPFVCYPSISTIPESLMQANFSVHKINFEGNNFLNLIKQINFIWKNNIKIIYFTDFNTYDFKYLFYRIVGVQKIIIHDHSPGTRSSPSHFKFKLKKFIHKLSWICADGCFAVSPYVAERMRLINGVPEHKIFCVTNGIPFFQDYTLNKVANLNKVSIISVARATYYKGIDFAIKVIAQLVRKNPELDITYTLYGDGPDLESLKKLSLELNIFNHVIFAGKIDDIPEKLMHADIAFHPSRGEAMSLAILEYMRAELPVVVSSNPSVSSFLTDQYDALIYEENSIESAANSLQQLMDSIDYRRSIGINAKNAVKNKFNDSLMYEKLSSSIDQVLKR